MTHQQELSAQTLAEAKLQKLQEIEATYLTNKYANFEHTVGDTTYTFDFPRGQVHQTDLASLITGGVTNVGWLDVNRQVAITTMVDLITFSKALNDRASALFLAKNAKTALVDSATTKAAVRNIGA